MKNVIVRLLLIFLAIGCSRNKSATAPLPLTLTHGDIASPAEVTPDKIGARTVYRVAWKLSATKVAALCKLAQEHPNRKIKIMAGSKVVAELRAPANPHDVDPSNETNLIFTTVSDSKEEARVFADSLNKANQE